MRLSIIAVNSALGQPPADYDPEPGTAASVGWPFARGTLRRVRCALRATGGEMPPARLSRALRRNVSPANVAHTARRLRPFARRLLSTFRHPRSPCALENRGYALDGFWTADTCVSWQALRAEIEKPRYYTALLSGCQSFTCFAGVPVDNSRLHW